MTAGRTYRRAWIVAGKHNDMTEGSPTQGAERMRRYRERRRRGLSCIKVQLRRSEVDALIACKLLEPTERENRRALAAALHRYLDVNPIAGFRR
jgi:hypothetical protein